MTHETATCRTCQKLFRTVLAHYLTRWWGLRMRDVGRMSLLTMREHVRAARRGAS